MRILQVIRSAAPEGGGPIEAIIQAGDVLAKAGHETEIACLDPPGAAWIADLALRIHPLGPSVTPLHYSRRFVPWLRAHGGQYDCVIVHGVWGFVSVGTWLALRKSGVPYFVYSHGMLDPAHRRLFPLKHLKKTVYWKAIEHRVVRDARAVLFTCREERELASKSFRPQEWTGSVVPYCVPEPPTQDEVGPEIFVERFPEIQNKRILLFLSRLHPKKGCDDLIKAFARVCSRDPDLHLVMAGPDEVSWQKELVQRARELGVADRVLWTGMLQGPVKWSAFRAADAFVLPTHQENFGIAIVEALCCGCPVLITDRANIWREIQEGEAGLVGSDGVDGCLELLERWLEMSADETRSMRIRTTRCFRTYFQRDKAGRLLIDTLRRHGVNG